MADAMNFYLAASAVIPVLALRVEVRKRRLELEPVSEAAQRERAAVLPWMAGGLGLVVWACAFYAEFVCLRRLEMGHAPPPGAGIVWAALVLLAVPTHDSWIVERLASKMMDYGYRHMYHGLHGRNVDDDA